eukprot:TRINITY_DN6099_c0_g1_i2.p1 TRINITY_DN6099_c0_g1~~TRINITY_DN6099_c0_g1_i2.p1  ORF type:complete len:477 (+),score=80.74 TRINITY_DN6099_c0_g1_i2:529-1959(+)
MVFKDYTGYEQVISLKDKSYAKILFDSITNASKFYELFNDKQCEKLDRLVLFEYARYFEVDNCTNFDDVEGLYYIENFISEVEEQEILNEIECNPWDRLSRRSVQHYGFEYNYSTNKVDAHIPLGIIPEWIKMCIERMDPISFIPNTPDQVTVNRYPPGAGIPPHVDTHSVFEDGILSLSLQNGITMDLKHNDGRKREIYLKPRSLLILTGESRYVWSHGIAPRKSDIVNNEKLKRGTRTSLSFRTIRDNGPCGCGYPLSWECDTWLDLHFATRTEQKYNYETYESIATEYSNQKKDPDQKIIDFINDQCIGSIVYDIGCGNGRYKSKISDNFPYIGIDTSENLCKIAKFTFNTNNIVSNILKIPVRDNICDICLCMSVINHLSTEDHRAEALKELFRITKTYGYVVIKVRSLDSTKYSQQGVFVPWKEESIEPYQRYFYIYRDNELEETMENHDIAVNIVSKEYTSSGIIYILQK